MFKFVLLAAIVCPVLAQAHPNCSEAIKVLALSWDGCDPHV